MKKIVGIGNSLVDILAHIGNDDALNEMSLPKGSMQLIDSANLAIISKKMRNLEHTRASGGSASNTMKALAHMNVGSGFIGKITSDEFGIFFSTELERAGVHTALIRKQSGSTGIASTFISPDGQRTFATYLGVSAELSADDIQSELLTGYDILYVEGYLVQNHELMERVLATAKQRQMSICLDLASYNVVESDLEFFRYILTEYIDIVFANEEEARAFTGKEPKEAAYDLGELCSIAIVKMGSEGSCVFAENNLHIVPAKKVAKIVDTTGAGDYFAAGFLYGFVHQKSYEDCLNIGSTLAGAVIQVVGTTLHKADWDLIQESIAQ